MSVKYLKWHDMVLITAHLVEKIENKFLIYQMSIEKYSIPCLSVRRLVGKWKYDTIVCYRKFISRVFFFYFRKTKSFYNEKWKYSDTLRYISKQNF